MQSHTLTHPLLPQVDAQRSHEEIAGSKRAIEQHVPYALTSFCYPAGLYGAREVEFVREAGYAAAVTTNPGVERAAAAICSSCAARSSTAPTTCASSGPSSTGCSTARRVLRRALHARRSRAA